MERRKIKMRYNAKVINDFNENDVESLTIEKLLEHKINTSHSHIFSNYIHNVMVVLELIITNKYRYSYNKEHVLTLKEKFINCWLEKRQKITKSIRILIWLVICRINLLCHLHKYNEFDHGKLDTILDLVNTGVILFKKDVLDYTVLEFWKSLMMLISKFNNIVYSQQLFTYIRSLMSVCGTFVGVELNDSTAKDYTMMIKPSDKNTNKYVTTEYFWKETERISFHLESTIHYYQLLKKIQPDPEFYKAFNVNIFYKWLYEHTQGIYKKYILQKVSDSLYDVHVKKGDVERFKENNSFGIPTAYNTISAFRFPELDILATRINATLVEEIIDTEKANYERKWYTNEEFVLLCYITVQFLLDAKYKNTGIMNYFVMNKVPQESGLPLANSNFPKIHKVFNEYAVSYKGTTTPFAKFSEVFCYWIWMICTVLDGKILDTDEHVTDIFESLFPNEKQKIDNLRMINDKVSQLIKDVIDPKNLF